MAKVKCINLLNTETKLNIGNYQNLPLKQGINMVDEEIAKKFPTILQIITEKGSKSAPKSKVEEKKVVAPKPAKSPVITKETDPDKLFDGSDELDAGAGDSGDAGDGIDDKKKVVDSSKDSEATSPKKKAGRPKGSKNKKRAGRPKGSKNRKGKK